MNTQEKQMAIDSLKDYEMRLIELADQIWEVAEPAFEEFQSAEAICDFLESAGFLVERGIAGLPTAFKGTFGSGHPVIGILGEYDALIDLSQEAGCPVHHPTGGRCGHGCGHHELAASTLAGALIAKKYLEENLVQGTIVYFGCPAEEGGAGKAFMVRAGVFRGVDIALSSHPAGSNAVRTGTTCASLRFEYTFHGIKSHPATQPENGRSAFDALELFNIGINFLREHIKQQNYIHYAVTYAGGDAPNVIPDLAKGVYVVRSTSLEEARELSRRMDLCAQGAAISTETTYEKSLLSAGNHLISCESVERILYKNFEETDLPIYTEEDEKFGRKIFKSNPKFADAPDICCQFGRVWESEFRQWQDTHQETVFNRFLPSYAHTQDLVAGATDLAEVSWNLPTASIFFVTAPKKVSVHTWQFTAFGKTDCAHQGILMAGRVLGGTAIDFFADPALVEEAWKDFRKNLPGEYISPVEGMVVEKFHENRQNNI